MTASRELGRLYLVATPRAGVAEAEFLARVVFDRHARLPLDSQLVRTARSTHNAADWCTGLSPSE